MDVNGMQLEILEVPLAIPYNAWPWKIAPLMDDDPEFSSKKMMFRIDDRKVTGHCYSSCMEPGMLQFNILIKWRLKSPFTLL